MKNLTEEISEILTESLQDSVLNMLVSDHLIMTTRDRELRESSVELPPKETTTIKLNPSLKSLITVFCKRFWNRKLGTPWPLLNYK